VIAPNKVLRYCELCLAYEATDTHHICPQREDGCTNAKSNLIGLCKMCHMKVEQRGPGSEYLEVLGYFTTLSGLVCPAVRVIPRTSSCAQE
jgi:hypothetical protein